MTKKTAFAAGAALGLAILAGPALAIQIQSPRDGTTVRENVRVVVPRAGLTARGFVALYIDGEFISAEAPSTKLSAPVVFLWDSKQPRSSVGRTPEQREFAEGEHVIEVRAYDSDGKMLARDQVSVVLNNRVPASKGQPVHLVYKFRSDDKTVYSQRVEIESTGTTPPAGSAPTYSSSPGGYSGGSMSSGGINGPRGSMMSGGKGMNSGSMMPPGGMSSGGMTSGGMSSGGMMSGGGGSSGGAPSNETQKYTEFRKVTVDLADVTGDRALVSEVTENPVTLMMNGQKAPNTVPAVPRYYFMDAEGVVIRTAAMTREQMQPIFNVLQLPGYSVRVGQQWKSLLNISLGYYIPQRIQVIATNVVEAIEWEHGKPAARIKSTYDWSGKLTILPLGFNDATAKLRGSSVIHFAPGSGKPVRILHQLEGELTINPAQQGLGSTPTMSSGGSSMSGAAGSGGLGTSMFSPPLATYHAKIRASLTAKG